jgi:hypothetical protein
MLCRSGVEFSVLFIGLWQERRSRAREQADILQFGSFVDHGLQLPNIRLLTRAALF